MNIGNRVYVSGEVLYGNTRVRVMSHGTVEHVGLDASLISIDMINGDNNACVIVKNRYIDEERGVV